MKDAVSDVFSIPIVMYDDTLTLKIISFFVFFLVQFFMKSRYSLLAAFHTNRLMATFAIWLIKLTSYITGEEKLPTARHAKMSCARRTCYTPSTSLVPVFREKYMAFCRNAAAWHL